MEATREGCRTKTRGWRGERTETKDGNTENQKVEEKESLCLISGSSRRSDFNTGPTKKESWGERREIQEQEEVKTGNVRCL